LIHHREKNGALATVRSVAILALLLGVAIASFLPILHNIRRLEVIAAMFLGPGGILASLMAPVGLTEHPLLLVAGNAIVYAICSFGLCLALRRWLTATTIRLGAWVIGLLAVVLFAIACVPRFDPLWPHGMVELRAREAELKKLVQPDLTIDQVRAALQRESIPVHEETENSTREVLRNHDTQIVAAAGDRLVFSRFRTDAVQYPCGYDLQVVVLFAPDGKIKNRYVAALPICP